jgi:hypothetical protein
MPLGILLLVCCLVLFYRLGDYEFGSGFVTAGLSLLFGALALFVFSWGVGGYIASQVALLLLLWGYNVRRQERRRRGG